jgi:hypothetical protein
MNEGYEMFDDEYDAIVAKDQFDAEYGDLLTDFDSDEFNDEPDWLAALNEENEDW